MQLESIPVGCVPSTAVTLGGGVLLGVYFQRGVGVCFRGMGGCLARGGYVFQHACTETDTPNVNRMTDRCKNITLPQLRCGR